MKYELVYIDLLDHCNTPADNPAPVPCYASGFLVQETEQHFVLCHWASVKSVIDPQSDAQVIVKHPGIQLIRTNVFAEMKANNE